MSIGNTFDAQDSTAPTPLVAASTMAMMEHNDSSLELTPFEFDELDLVHPITRLILMTTAELATSVDSDFDEDVLEDLEHDGETDVTILKLVMVGMRLPPGNPSRANALSCIDGVVRRGLNINPLCVQQAAEAAA